MLRYISTTLATKSHTSKGTIVIENRTVQIGLKLFVDGGYLPQVSNVKGQIQWLTPDDFTRHCRRPAVLEELLTKQRVEL